MLVLLALIAFWSPGKFTFAIAGPVAAQDFRFKAAAFVFRTENCADPKADISAAAEGLVDGARKTVKLQVQPSQQKPGVYAVFQTWPKEGAWLVNLSGTCGKSTAGALIPVGPQGFVRESSQFFARPATDAEIAKALVDKTGGKK